MMISDNERREVAATLRGLKEHRDEAPLIFTEQVHNAMVLRAIRAVVGKGDVFQRLADLIDRPTCKNVGGEKHAFMCSKCGAYTTEFSHFFAPKEEQEKLKSELREVMGLDREETRFLSIHSSVPKHCPWCGAEVVR